ncbi:MAG: hypothetical protein R2942_11070 [Ignavibacteria bacterium]
MCGGVEVEVMECECVEFVECMECVECVSLWSLWSVWSVSVWRVECMEVVCRASVEV